MISVFIYPHYSKRFFKTSTYTNILLYSSQLITSVVIYDNSNPACCSMASNNLFFKVSSSLIIGSFSRFKQVLAVGILFSVPDDCIQNCGFSSWKLKHIMVSTTFLKDYGTVHKVINNLIHKNMLIVYKPVLVISE